MHIEECIYDLSDVDSKHFIVINTYKYKLEVIHCWCIYSVTCGHVENIILWETKKLPEAIIKGKKFPPSCGAYNITTESISSHSVDSDSELDPLFHSNSSKRR